MPTVNMVPITTNPPMATSDLYSLEKLFYTDNGSKDAHAAILMHGWGCTHSTVASIEKILLDCGMRVINVDFPGFGNSPEPAETWGVEEYTNLIERLSASLNLDAPMLIGHSFGGRVAILMASRNRVGKVILVDAAGVKPSRPLSYYIKVYRFKLYKKILRIILGAEAAEARIEAQRRKKGSADYASASPRMRMILSKVVNEDLCHVMPLIKAPTLLIYGENDTATPVNDARKIEKLVPGSGLVVFEGAGHYSFLDRPGQFAAVMRSFLNS